MREDRDPEICLMASGLFCGKAEFGALEGHLWGTEVSIHETNGRWCTTQPPPAIPRITEEHLSHGRTRVPVPYSGGGVSKWSVFIPMVVLPLGILKVWHLQLEAQGPSTSLLDRQKHMSEAGPTNPQGFSRMSPAWLQDTEGFLLSCGGEGDPSPFNLENPFVWGFVAAGNI